MIKWFKKNKQAWTHRMRQLKKKKLPFTDLFEPLLRRIYCHIALSQLFVLSTTVIHLAQLYIKLYAACSCVLRYTIFFVSSFKYAVEEVSLRVSNKIELQRCMEAYELAEGQMALFLTSLLVRVGSLLSILMYHVSQHPHLLSPGKTWFERV